MLVVRVELWPRGIKEQRETLRTMVIANDVTGCAARGNYNVYLGHRGETNPWVIMDRPLRTGRVEDYPRLAKRDDELVLRALRAVR